MRNAYDCCASVYECIRNGCECMRCAYVRIRRACDSHASRIRLALLPMKEQRLIKM